MRFLALIVATTLLLQTHLGYAESVVTLNSIQKSPIESQLKQANESSEQIKIRRDESIAQLQNIENQYGAVAGSLHDLGVQMGGKRQRLKHLNQEMQLQVAKLKLQNKELSQQVKAAFVIGKKEQLRLLLNQQDSVLASRMLVYYTYLNKNRLKKLATLKKNIAMLENLGQQKHLETDLLAQSLRSRDAMQIGLGAAKKQRDSLLLKLKQEFREKSQQLAQLEDTFKQSQTLINQLQQTVLKNPQIPSDEPLDPQKTQAVTTFDVRDDKPFSELKGHLSWPIKGVIVKKFGSPRSETRWDGVLISAKEGTDIGAVSSGQVVFANWLRGYGLLIIINHGQGYMTLYAFNQSLYKKVGDKVKSGSIIAAVGKSDGREESGLYFGIRYKGKAINPVLWCRKS